MNDYKTRLAHYNDTEWQTMREYCMKDVDATSDYIRTVRNENRLTLLSYYIPLIALVAAALWLSVLPGVVIYAVVCGLATVAVNNVAEALE